MRNVLARAAAAVARGLGRVLLAVVMIVAAVLLNLDSAVVRRVTIAEVNSLVFTPLFRGTFTILSLGHVDPFGVSGVNVRVADPAGQQVLQVDDLRARIATLTLLRGLLSGSGDLVIDLSDVNIEHVDIRLDMDDAGIAIGNAFEPRPSPTPSPPSTEEGLRVHVYAPLVRIHRAWGHGLMLNLPRLDGDVSDLDAAFTFDATRLLVEARHGRVLARGIALGADAQGSFRGHIAVSLGTATTPVEVGGGGQWDGTVGTLHERVIGSLEKGRLDASIDLPEATPEAIRSVWPASLIVGTGSAHVEAHGPVEAVDLAVHAGLGAATSDITGVLGWGATKSAKLHLEVADVDLHEILPVVDPSNLGVRGDVTATLSETGRLEGEADLDVPAGHVGPHRVPPTTLRTHGFRESGGAFGGDAKVTVAEPGAPTTVTLHAVPSGQSSSIEFSVVSDAVRLARLQRFQTGASGNGHLVGKGKIDIERQELDVELDLRGDCFSHGKLRVGSLTMDGRARGRWPDPVVDLSLHGRDVAWGDLLVSQLDVTAYGKAMSPHVTVRERSAALPSIDAVTDLDLLKGPALRNTTITLSRPGQVARVVVEHARLAPGNLEISGVAIEGLGEPLTLSGDWVGSSAHVRVHAPSVALASVAALVGTEDPVRGGTVAIDADVAIHGGEVEGAVTAKVEHACLLDKDDASAHFEGRLEHRRLVGKAGARATGIGWVELTAENLTLGGGAPMLHVPWREVWGDIGLEGQVDLAALANRLPPGTLPVSAVRGVVELKGRFERDSKADITPLVSLDAKTTGLRLSAAAAPAAPVVAPTTAPLDPKAVAYIPVPPPPAWTLDGVDVATAIRVNGDTGVVNLTTSFRDAVGELAKLEAKSSDIPYSTLFGTPEGLAALLPAIGFDAHLAVPRRAVQSWPKALGRMPVDGDLQGDVHVTGPLKAPRVEVSAKLMSLKAAVARLTSPLEIELSASYATGHADAKVHAMHNGHSVLTSEAHAAIDVADILAGGPIPWTASGKVHVEDFPLVTVGPLDDRGVRGRVTGDVVLDDLHKDARARVTLSATSLKVGDAVYPTARASIEADGKNISVDARLEESDGFGAVHAAVPATWGAALAPQPDPKQALQLTLEASHFRAAAILPFLRGSIDELDGLIDAKVSATLDPVTEALHATGSVELNGGVFQLASFGGELHNITAKATIAQDGVVTLERFAAFGVSGEVMASASARLDGLRLAGASAIIQIPKSRPLPLSVGGTTLGTLDGTLNVTESLSADRKTVEIKTTIPKLHMVVAAAGSQDVQPLGPMAGVRVGTRSGGTFVADGPNAGDQAESTTMTRAEDAVKIHIVTSFGDDVSIQKGTDVHVELQGGPTLTITDKVQASGQVRIRSGSLNLYGKAFEIEQGTVTFVGDDISNPQVSVTAGWTASDGTLVKADFIGPLKTGKVTLRSEPTLPNNEIVQLLLFGTTDGTAAAAQGAPGTSSAEGVAGNIATQPLNHALAQFGLSAVSAKVDTSSVNAKPEVEVQIAKNISVAVAQILGAPPVGGNPDTSFLTVDWRFLRKWSVAATIGNADTTIVDLLWRYRY